MIRFSLVTGPAAEPVTLAAFKAHAKVEHSEEDALYTGFITAARQTIEQHTGRVIGAQTWRAELAAWPAISEDNRRRVRLAPVPSSVTWVKVDGTEIATSLWALRGDELIVAYEAPAPNGSALTSGIEVRFAAGDTPEPLLLAVKLLASHWIENREAIRGIGDAGIAMPFGVAHLITPYRVLRL